MIKIGRLYINLFVVPLIFASFITNSLLELAASYITVTLHELAHLVFALYYKVGVSGFVIMPFGVSIRLKESQIDNPIHECMICAAGPACNLILIILVFCARQYFIENIMLLNFFICSNASIFLINTIPVVPLDGGRILRAALTAKYGFVRAAKTAHIISQINIAVIGLFGVYILYITHFNVSVMLLCAFLIFNMSAEKKNNEFTLMRQLVHSKEKLVRRKVMPVRQLAADGTVPVRQLLKRFSYESYYIVNVMDKNMKIQCVLTETEIIDSLSQGLKSTTLNNLCYKLP